MGDSCEHEDMTREEKKHDGAETVKEGNPKGTERRERNSTMRHNAVATNKMGKRGIAGEWASERRVEVDHDRQPTPAFALRTLGRRLGATTPLPASHDTSGVHSSLRPRNT
ncbi:hypothetical protein AB1N83_013946 [Pleurotus pulmonarius]